MDHRARLDTQSTGSESESSSQNAEEEIRPVKLLSRIAGLFLVLGSISSSLQAQAWLFPKGGGTVTFGYQNIFIRYHVDGTGTKFDQGHLIENVMSIDTDYSVTDRLAIKVGIPYVASRYYGDKPHKLTPDTPPTLDDGKYHPTFQDFSFEARYNLTNRSVVLTPFFRVSIPSHSYEYFSHSAVGKDVREYRVGANVGRRLDPILRNAYVQGRYAFGISQPVLDIALKRSYTDVQLGYILSRRLTLVGVEQWLHSHTGEVADFSTPFPSPEEKLHHDQTAKSTLLDISGGAAVTLSRSTDFFVSVGRSLRGTSGHLNSAVVSIGISRSFGIHSETTAAQNGPGPTRDSASK
jgi:hypothetical protein